MIGLNLDIYTVVIQTFLGTELINSEQIQAPSFILQSQFIQIAQQISQDKSRPMSVKMIVPYEFYCNFDNKMKKLDNYVEFSNYEKDYRDIQ